MFRSVQPSIGCWRCAAIQQHQVLLAPMRRSAKLHARASTHCWLEPFQLDGLSEVRIARHCDALRLQSCIFRIGPGPRFSVDALMANVIRYVVLGQCRGVHDPPHQCGRDSDLCLLN